MSNHEEPSEDDVPRTEVELTRRITKNGKLVTRPQRWTYPSGREIHVLPDLGSGGLTDILIAEKTDSGSIGFRATTTEIHTEGDVSCEFIELDDSWFADFVDDSFSSLPHEMASARDMLAHIVEDWNEIPDAGKVSALGHVIDDLEVAQKEVAE
ncbi:hypothetical protein [Haladaptatus cibarius]|uniref:hypothetical protein n=1 Tax=Haladaptatus cibarius TaxID=453847 RepID=UPI000678BDD2|nr:hypothetical protein [Haladaptatus cibarius]